MAAGSSVSGNVIQTFFVQIPNYLLGIIAGIFLTRQLGPDGKGVYTLLIANVQLLVMFLGLNLTGAIQFFMANGKMTQDRIAGIAFWLVLLACVIAFALLFLPINMGETFFPSGFDGYFYRAYLWFSFLISLINSFLGGFLLGAKQFRLVNRVSLINSILNFIIFTSVYYAHMAGIIKVDFITILVLTLCILMINGSIYLNYVLKQIKLKISFKVSWKKDWLPLMRFLVPAYISVLINFFNYRFVIWIVNSYEGSEQLGYFSLALGFAQMMLMVTNAINTVMFPHLTSKGSFDAAAADFRLAFKINFLIMVLAALFLVFSSQWLIPLFYGDVFLPSVAPFNILVMGIVMLAQSQVYGHFFGALNKNWLNSLVYGIALCSVVALSFVLVPKFGISGGAWANSISYMIMFLSFTVISLGYFKMQFLALFFIQKKDINRLRSVIARFRGK